MDQLLAGDSARGSQRLAFSCRVNQVTVDFLDRLPGSNGQKVDYVVALVRSMAALVPPEVRRARTK